MEKKKINDRGFSLVELIIVIAIMAILIGVLAPQYLRYVERSRQSTDKQNMDEIVTAIEVWASETSVPDGETALTTDTSGTTLTISKSDALSLVGDNADAITDALTEYGVDTDLTLKSGNWGQSGTVTIVITVDGNMNVVAEEQNPSNDIGSILD